MGWYVSAERPCARCGAPVVWREQRDRRGRTVQSGYYELDRFGAAVDAHHCDAGAALPGRETVPQDYVPGRLALVAVPIGGVPDAQHERELSPAGRARFEYEQAERLARRRSAAAAAAPTPGPAAICDPDPLAQRLIDRLGI